MSHTPRKETESGGTLKTRTLALNCIDHNAITRPHSIEAILQDGSNRGKDTEVGPGWDECGEDMQQHNAPVTPLRTQELHAVLFPRRGSGTVHILARPTVAHPRLLQARWPGRARCSQANLSTFSASPYPAGQPDRSQQIPSPLPLPEQFGMPRRIEIALTQRGASKTDRNDCPSTS